MNIEKINDGDEFIKVGSESIKDFPKKCNGLKLNCMLGLNKDFKSDYYAFTRYKPNDEYVLIITRMVIYKKVKPLTSATPTSNKGMELTLNPIPSQNNNKNNGSGTKPPNEGI